MIPYKKNYNFKFPETIVGLQIAIDELQNKRKKTMKKETWTPPPKNKKISKNFTYGELIRSQTAARQGIDNTPTEEEYKNLLYIVRRCLEPVRRQFGTPVIITSGFRCLELNRAIGSHDGSQHISGEAIDFVVQSKSIDGVFRWITTESLVEWDQIIHEFGEWIHISYVNDRENRNEILTAKRNQSGNVYYEKWTENDVKNGVHLK